MKKLQLMAVMLLVLGLSTPLVSVSQQAKYAGKRTIKTTTKFNGKGTPSIGTKNFEPSTLVDPYNLVVGYSKTTFIIFPAAIKSIDRGSTDIIVQKAEASENVMRIKADKEQFLETNLTVITADGRLYSFLVNYEENPKYFTVNLNLEGVKAPGVRMLNTGSTASGQTAQMPAIEFGNVKMSETKMAAYGEQVAGKRREIRNIKEKKNNLYFALEGIYIKDNVIFYKLDIRNRSELIYDIDFIKFYIRDKKQVKRVATQDIEVEPLYVSNDTSAVGGWDKVIKVFALQKFTIPDEKDLIIEMFEKDGGRHTKLKVGNKDILNALKLKE